MEKEKKHRTSSDEMLNASYEYNEVSYKYDAFISYRHVEPDQTVAKYVHQMIEIFKAPKASYKDGKSPVFRVFRDREELAARDLGASIEEALAQSRYLVVICSKRTPLSEWCQKDIEIFKGLHGEERIIPVLIEGEPDEAFPSSLKEIKDQGDGHEILITLNTNTDDRVTRRSLKDGSIIDVIPKIYEKNIITQEDSYKPYKSAAYSADGQNILLLTDAEIIKMSFDKQEVFRKDMYINTDDNKVIYESDDGGKIAVKSNTKIYILDGNTGEISDEICFEKLNLKYYVYNPDTNTVVGFGENGNYSIWKDNTVVEDNLKYGNSTPVEFKFLKDGSKILANSHESQAIKIIDLKSRVSSESIYARIMANSNDSSKMLLFNGKDVLLSSDGGKTSSKINVDESTIDGVAPDRVKTKFQRK